MAEAPKNEETPGQKKRIPNAIRLRKAIDVTVEDKLSLTSIHGAIADISATGMRMICDQHLPKATKYTFTMKREPALVLRGEVRWVRPFDPDRFQVGVLFVDVSRDAGIDLNAFLELERQRVATKNA